MTEERVHGDLVSWAPQDAVVLGGAPREVVQAVFTMSRDLGPVAVAEGLCPVLAPRERGPEHSTTRLSAARRLGREDLLPQQCRLRQHRHAGAELWPLSEHPRQERIQLGDWLLRGTLSHLQLFEARYDISEVLGLCHWPGVDAQRPAAIHGFLAIGAAPGERTCAGCRPSGAARLLRQLNPLRNNGRHGGVRGAARGGVARGSQSQRAKSSRGSSPGEQTANSRTVSHRASFPALLEPKRP
mmetsp:Transcript_12350/g.28178  ORF Transcript_12350/g.28178 Transcript_12350/m.28178 type:complete len:242 (+) Transcript_12350:614-1339(+)